MVAFGNSATPSEKKSNYFSNNESSKVGYAIFSQMDVQTMKNVYFRLSNEMRTPFLPIAEFDPIFIMATKADQNSIVDHYDYPSDSLLRTFMETEVRLLEELIISCKHIPEDHKDWIYSVCVSKNVKKWLADHRISIGERWPFVEPFKTELFKTEPSKTSLAKTELIKTEQTASEPDQASDKASASSSFIKRWKDASKDLSEKPHLQMFSAKLPKEEVMKPDLTEYSEHALNWFRHLTEAQIRNLNQLALVDYRIYAPLAEVGRRLHISAPISSEVSENNEAYTNFRREELNHLVFLHRLNNKCVNTIQQNDFIRETAHRMDLYMCMLSRKVGATWHPFVHSLEQNHSEDNYVEKENYYSLRKKLMSTMIPKRCFNNCRSSCFMNAALQLLMSATETRDRIASENSFLLQQRDKTDQKQRILASYVAELASQHRMEERNFGSFGASQTNYDKTIAGLRQCAGRVLDKIFDDGYHQDASEFLQSLVDHMISSTFGNVSAAFELFNVHTVDETMCTKCYDSDNHRYAQSVLFLTTRDCFDFGIDQLLRMTLGATRDHGNCNRCKERTILRRQKSIMKTNKYILLCLARFLYDQTYKDNTPVKILETLEVDNNGLKVNYQLKSIIVHLGLAIAGGHFITLERNSDKSFTSYDDSFVFEIGSDFAMQMASRDAFVLCYERDDVCSN